MKLRTAVFIASIALLLTVQTFAQDVAVPAPATTLPTTTRARREAQIPPGFSKVEVGGRTVLVEPADAQSTQQLLSAMKPTSRPSLVATMLDRAKQHRDEIVNAIAQEVGSDANTVGASYDEHVTSQLQKLYDIKPPILYLLASLDRVKELLKSGWQDPNFYFNRAADRVVLSGSVAIRSDGPMDDSVIGAIYDAKGTPEARDKALTDAIAQTENDLNKFLDAQAKSTFGAGLATVVNEVALKGLTFKDDQRWFQLGVPVVLASKLAAGPTDQPDLLKAMTMENPQNPLRFGSIDLLHPPAMTSMNPEAVPYYVDTARRKSAAAILKLLEAGGQGTLAKVLTAMHTQMPPDGPALVKLIQDQTGVDLTKELAH